MARDPFRGVRFDEDRFLKAMSRRAAGKRYVICFTPRSGSSRLTDILTHTGTLGTPGEFFNPAFIPDIAQTFSARNLTDYVDLVLRLRNTDGIFGCEITYPQIFGSFGGFMESLQPTATLSLIREDIVAQAVSISRMVQTKVSHSTASSCEEIAGADDRFSYAPRQIERYLCALAWMEHRTHDYLSGCGACPLRLTYERTIAMAPSRLVRMIATHVGVGDDLPGADSAHHKLGQEKSMDFATRFRRERPQLIRTIDRNRHHILQAHRQQQD